MNSNEPVLLQLVGVKTSAINYSRHIKHPPRERDRRVTCANEALHGKTHRGRAPDPSRTRRPAAVPSPPRGRTRCFSCGLVRGTPLCLQRIRPPGWGRLPTIREGVTSSRVGGGVLCKAATRGSFLSRRTRRHTPGPADRRPPTSRMKVLPLVLVPVRGTSSAGDLKAACAS